MTDSHDRGHGTGSDQLRPPDRTHPLAASLLVAVGYMVFFSIYILVSGRIAAGISPTVIDLQRLELAKGIIFVIVTGVSLFALVFFYLRRLREQDLKLVSQTRKLVETERLVTTGLFAASVSHDMNNMLTALNGYTDILEHHTGIDDEARATVREISATVDALSKIAERTLTTARSHIPGQRSDGDLVQLANGAVDFARRHPRIRRCTIDFDAPEKLNARVNPTLVTRALVNLMLNSAEAIDGEGVIRISLTRSDRFIAIEIHDDGPGIPDHERTRILEPFYTTKGDGSGLGLLSVRICAEEHEGTIEIGDSDLGGARFRLTLPV